MPTFVGFDLILRDKRWDSRKVFRLLGDGLRFRIMVHYFKGRGRGRGSEKNEITSNTTVLTRSLINRILFIAENQNVRTYYSSILYCGCTTKMCIFVGALSGGGAHWLGQGSAIIALFHPTWKQKRSRYAPGNGRCCARGYGWGPRGRLRHYLNRQ